MPLKKPTQTYISVNPWKPIYFFTNLNHYVFLHFQKTKFFAFVMGDRQTVSPPYWSCNLSWPSAVAKPPFAAYWCQCSVPMEQMAKNCGLAIVFEISPHGHFFFSRHHCSWCQRTFACAHFSCVIFLFYLQIRPIEDVWCGPLHSLYYWRIISFIVSFLEKLFKVIQCAVTSEALQLK